LNRGNRDDRETTGEEGWTFVETLLVIGIMLILTSGVGVAGSKLIGRAKILTVRHQITSFSAALEIYRIDCGRYPTEGQGLAALWEKPVLQPVPSGWAGPYTTRPPGTDPWGGSYEYQCPGPAGTPYGIRSLGGDGKMGGTEDDIVSWE
jgi:general secretion pathway protein G